MPVSELGQATGIYPANADEGDAVRHVVYAASRTLYVGPHLVSEDGFMISARACAGSMANGVAHVVVCNFDELQKVPGIQKAKRCPNCPRT